MSCQSWREVIQEGWTGSCGRITSHSCAPVSSLGDQGGATAAPEGLRPSGHGCSAGLGPQTHWITLEAAFSPHAFLLPFKLDPAPSLPPAALHASLFQDFVPLMAETFPSISQVEFIHG